jgi:hypothetical protein
MGDAHGGCMQKGMHPAESLHALASVLRPTPKCQATQPPRRRRRGAVRRRPGVVRRPWSASHCPRPPCGPRQLQPRRPAPRRPRTPRAILRCGRRHRFSLRAVRAARRRGVFYSHTGLRPVVEPDGNLSNASEDRSSPSDELSNISEPSGSTT